MRGLLLRLSTLDADAATALKVIAFFDALVERHAGMDALVRATSGLAECGCGMRLDGRQWRFGPTGNALTIEQECSVSGRAEFRANETAGCLWLERPGGPAPMDDLVLERASLAARILLNNQRSRPVAGLADPALMEAVLSTHESLVDRCRALRALGLASDQPLRVAAVRVAAGRDPAVDAIALIARLDPTRSAHVAVVGGIAAVLFQQKGTTCSPAPDLRNALRGRSQEQGLHAGVHVGVGANADCTDAERSWEQALTALRFAPPANTCLTVSDPGAAVVDYDELGVLALLAEIPPDRLTGNPYIAALNAFGATESGALDLATLEAYCRTGSLRQAAQILYLHHSTVASRLARVEEAMNWHLDDPAERFRAQLALWARRLVHPSAAPPGDG
ncbi:PucR family transcriptional regulator [Mycobacterium terramassiliense]|uniref:LysR family transcriptional regulator n=1 Tax=Mycobacterium terramassiliense TaxID=1841859 RepID=A0A2U3NGD0_9MYCO|nr:helix-turn-helix domain-containing protein [Mycobacterium terramassiliense]SPM30606.1 LysR family transcriptional regulator [Mycobacterium terramassiliense]